VRRWRQRWTGGDCTVEDRDGRGRKAHFPPSRPCPGGRHRLRNRGPNQAATEPPIAWGSDATS
jgi:hypothetical protein